MNIIRCDRCATEISETTDAHLVTDQQWLKLSIISTGTRHLCPPCSLSFRQFMEGPPAPAGPSRWGPPLSFRQFMAQPRPKP